MRWSETPQEQEKQPQFRSARACSLTHEQDKKQRQRGSAEDLEQVCEAGPNPTLLLALRRTRQARQLAPMP